MRAIPFLLAGVALAQPRFVDIHLHWSDQSEFLPKVLETYRKNKALACVSAPIGRLDRLKQLGRENPDVIQPFLRADLDDPEVIPQIDKAHAAGFRGVKIHSPLKNYDDPSYFPVFARAERWRMVTLLHTGVSSQPDDRVPRLKSSMARMRPMYLDTLARAFPELTIVGAHLGNPWYEEAAEAARWDPNLFFDVTGSTLIKKGDDLASFKKILWWGPVAGAMHMPKDTPHAFEKIVFGTDNDPLEVVIDRYTKLMDACGVPAEVRKKVFSETMLRKLQ